MLLLVLMVVLLLLLPLLLLLLLFLLLLLVLFCFFHLVYVRRCPISLSKKGVDDGLAPGLPPGPILEAPIGSKKTSTKPSNEALCKTPPQWL